MLSETMRAYQGRQPQKRDAYFDHPEVWEVRGVNRDEDGVDWVPDPPEALRKWLLLLKMENESKGIGLFEILRSRGAKPNGLMQKDQFAITLANTYRDWQFSTKLLKSFCPRPRPSWRAPGASDGSERDPPSRPLSCPTSPDRR